MKRHLNSPCFNAHGMCTHCFMFVGKHKFKGGDVLCPKGSLSTIVRGMIDRKMDSAFTVDDLIFYLPGVSRDLVDQVLHREVQSKRLERVQRGVYAKCSPSL